MPLSPGARIGYFDVLGSLGAGGMGEVYRARDAKLKREVAIKSLPPVFASDPDRLARFQREAEVLAALNHPNIAAIHELHEEQGSRFLVMELVEGETLAERIRRNKLSLDEVINIACQIAEGFEAAHEKGIVHRDLKPANIKITPDGRVKILDFGLAKACEASTAEALSQSPTLINGATAGGIIMGTAAYMSPEQARGRGVTKQSDIWAFGCVLHEMLTAETTFSSETVSDTIAKILKDQPNLSNVDAAIRPILVRCLERDPRKRYRDIGDVALDLERVPLSKSPATTNVASKRRSLPLAVALIFIGILLTIVLIQLSGPRPLTVSWTGTYLPGPTVAMSPRVSTDGRLVAFLAMVEGMTQVAVMQTNSSDWTLLTQDRSMGPAGQVNWSTDSTRIYYTRAAPAGESAIFSVPAVGGDERLVLEKAGVADVLPDGSLLILRTNTDRQKQLHRFWPDTGRIQEYPAVVESFANSVGLRTFKNGNEVVFWGRLRDQLQTDLQPQLYIIDLRTAAVKRVETDAAAAVAGGGLSLSPDGKEILLVSLSGDSNSVVQIPRDGGPGRILFSTTSNIWDVSAAADGSIYIDQVLRPHEIIRVGTTQANLEHVLTTVKFDEEPTRDMALPLPDGRLIVPGNKQLLVVKPGSQATPFIQTKDAATAPMTMVGTNEIAFILGRGPSAKLAIANATDGRILRRFEKVQAGGIENLAASPDGKTIYYVVFGKIWAVPSGDGEAKMIRPGDGVAVDPLGKYLIVQLNEERTRLVRVPLNGDPEEPLTFPGILGSFPPAPNAIRSDGAILKPMITGWIWSAALLHPDSGRVEPIPIPNTLDVFYLGWTADGRILCSCKQLHSSIWRFKPVL